MKSYLPYLYWCCGACQLLLATQVAIAAWVKVKKSMEWQGKLSRETPLWEGRWLLEFNKLKGFQAWDLIGVSKLGDLIDHVNIVLFSSLQRDYAMHKNKFLKYAQVRHTWRAERLPGEGFPRLRTTEREAVDGNVGKKHSFIYL